MFASSLPSLPSRPRFLPWGWDGARPGLGTLVLRVFEEHTSGVRECTRVGPSFSGRRDTTTVPKQDRDFVSPGRGPLGHPREEVYGGRDPRFHFFLCVLEDPESFCPTRSLTRPDECVDVGRRQMFRKGPYFSTLRGTVQDVTVDLPVVDTPENKDYRFGCKCLTDRRDSHCHGWTRLKVVSHSKLGLTSDTDHDHGSGTKCLYL